MAGWTLDDIPWQAFDHARVDPAIIPVIKAASMVEANAADYRSYLLNVFHDDPRVRTAIDGWAVEEVRHGMALARWATLDDPGFDFEACFTHFTAGYSIPVQARESVRRSRIAESGVDHPPLYEIFLGHSFAWLSSAEPCSIHAVVTDPPCGLVEYSEAQLKKMKSGRGGVWRIPPSFDGCQRKPLRRFTVLTENDRNSLRAFFQSYPDF